MVNLWVDMVMNIDYFEFLDFFSAALYVFIIGFDDFWMKSWWDVVCCCCAW